MNLRHFVVLAIVFLIIGAVVTAIDFAVDTWRAITGKDPL